MIALVRNDQEDLAKQLDEELAEQFIKKPPAVLGMSLSLMYSELYMKPREHSMHNMNIRDALHSITCAPAGDSC